MVRILFSGRSLFLGVVVVVALLAVSVSSYSEKPVMAAVPPVLDDDVVLPSRVSAAMDRMARRRHRMAAARRRWSATSPRSRTGPSG